MGYLIFSIIVILVFFGIYYITKSIFLNLVYKKLDVKERINCFITIDGCENSLEMFFKKFLYMYLDNSIFQNITILTKNQTDDCKYILRNILKKYPGVELIENAEIDVVKKEDF